MKILVNASTLVVGGGIQVGVSFIENVIKNNDFEWLFLVSEGIYLNLSDQLKNDSRIKCVKTSPSRVFSGIKSRKFIKQIARRFKPSIVYSVGFPSYISFKEIEIGRYTNPWEFNDDPLPWHTVSGLHRKIIVKLGIIYRRLWARNADYIETQTEAAKRGISKKIFFPKRNIKVIPNSLNKLFLQEKEKIEFPEDSSKKENLIFCLSAPYEHKNLDLIPLVANVLKNKHKLSVQFILTIPEDSSLWMKINTLAKKLEVSELISNVGVLKIKDCLYYYKKSKLVFLPTLLEVFSATYLESMALKVPIVTSDLSFARDNCKDAALFFEAGNANDAALKIKQLITDKELYKQLINKGERVLSEYPSIDEKYQDLLNYFKKIIRHEFE